MRVPIAIGVGALLGAAGLWSAATFARAVVGEDDASASPEPAGLALTTTQVQRQDLVLFDEATATLEFVDDATVSAPASGTVTSLAAEGSTIEAGTVVATIDNSPVVALYGDVPGWRDLDTSSDDGVDVHQLELNLVLLGFDPDGEIEIDQEFDDATEAAVERWQESLGLDGDGEVPQSMVAFVGGSVLVETTSATIGAGVSQGAALATGKVLERVVLVASTSDAEGEVTDLAEPGTPVRTGTVLFVDAGRPVFAVEGDPASLPSLERDLDLASSDGADVELLETALVANGFDAGGALVVDDDFDDATSQAVHDWYASLGLTNDDDDPADMTVSAGSFVVIGGDLEVGRSLLDDGGDVAAAAGVDAPVLTLTRTPRLVETTAPLGNDTFAQGATLEVVYPDGTTTAATVTAVGTTATNPSGEPGATPTVDITITPDEVPASVEGFLQIPVTLRIVTETIVDAYVVPVSALVALAEGGYALEVDDGAATHLVAVETGTFVDGFVEVTGDGLADGIDVVVPA